MGNYCPTIFSRANFYMVWFSKKYEKQLALLEEGRRQERSKEE